MESLPEGFLVRRLASSDYPSYLPLLEQLTTVGPVTEDQFREQFAAMDPDIYHIYVVEHVPTHCVVAAASLVIERKFIHQCGKVGHIEDVVTDSRFRGQKLGHTVIRKLYEVAQSAGCYKV